MSSIATDSVLTGSLFLGTEFEWNGVNELKKICLYNDYTTEASQVLNVDFLLKDIVELCAFKLVDFGRKRWKMHLIDNENESISNFFWKIFNNEKNKLIGRTKYGVVLKIRHKDSIADTPISMDVQADHLIIFGEYIPGTDKVVLYAQSLYTSYDYAASNCEIFCPTINELHEEESSVDTTVYSEPKHTPQLIEYYLEHKKIMDEMIEQYKANPTISLTPDVPNSIRIYKKMGDDFVEENGKNTRDVLLEANLAHKHRKQKRKEKKEEYMADVTNTSTSLSAAPKPPLPRSSSASRPPLVRSSSTVSTSAPLSSSYIPSQTSPLDYEAKKDLIKHSIKDEMKKQGLTARVNFFQQVYVGVKYTCRNMLKSQDEMDMRKLKHIVKMHVEFVDNMDTIASL